MKIGDEITIGKEKLITLIAEESKIKIGVKCLECFFYKEKISCFKFSCTDIIYKEKIKIII